MEDEARDLINAVSKGDLVDPINYEEWVDEKTKILKECDPHTDLMLFPEDDIEVTTLAKDFRTKDDVIPSAASTYHEDNPHVFDSVNMTIQDWSVVNRKYEKPLVSATLEDKNRNMVQHRYEIDLDPKVHLSLDEQAQLEKSTNNRASFASISEESFEMSEGDTMILSYLKDYTLPKIKVTDHANKTLRAKARPPSLFSLFPNAQTFDLDKTIESRKRPQVPHEHEKPHKVMITCTKLDMLPSIEPFYASMALYDARLKKKISETFHFDLNSNEMLKKAKNKLQFEVETRGTSAIFSITEPTADMCLLIRLEKTLQKDELSDCFEPYQRDTDNTKLQSKNAAIAEDFCSRLGKYRMPFVWVGFNLERALRGTDGLFLDSGIDYKYEGSIKESLNGTFKGETDNFDSISVGSIPVGMRFPSMDKKLRLGNMSNHSSYERLDSTDSSRMKVNLSNFPQKQGNLYKVFKEETDHLSDEDLCKYMFELNAKKNSTFKKLKFLPINVELLIEVAPYKDKAVLTPALRKVQPYNEEKDSCETERYKYPVREVEEFPGREVYIPYHDYKNFLYIYPMSLNFNNRTGSCRNIMVKIQLMESEGDEGVLKCIYGKSSTVSLTTEATTCVQYHNKSPCFYEEVKMELPPYLSKNHHLLFKFYHIVCQNPKPGDNKKAEKETLIGVTWLPLRMRLDQEGNTYNDDVLSLALGEHKLPVCTDIPRKEYSVISPKQFRLPSVTWVDDYKELFHVRVSAVSSVHQQDERLNEFTKCYYKYIQPLGPKDDPAAIETALKNSITGLQHAQDEPIVRQLYLTLDRLFALLVKPGLSPKGGSLSAISFKAITRLVSKVHQLHDKIKAHKLSRNGILASYVAYVFKTPQEEQCRANSRRASLSRFTESDEDSDGTPRNSPTKHSPQVLNQRCKSFTLAGKPDQEPDSSANVRGRSSSVIKKPSKRLHEQVVGQWLVSDARDIAYENAWFFFEIIVKSLAQHLHRHHSKPSSRKGWFPKDFKEDLNRLVNLISIKIGDTVVNNPPYAQFLNKSFAYFLQDLFSLMDRGFVFTLVKKYWSHVRTEDLLEDVSILKLSLLQVLCQHEHYVQLNLPYPHSLFNEKNLIKAHQFKAKLKSTNTALSLTSLNKTYCERHYLVGLLLSMNAHLLNFSTNVRVQRAVILLTRDILYHHDNEPNFHDSSRKSRVASLYLPFISIVMDVYDKLWKFKEPGRGNTDEFKILDESGEYGVNSPQGTLQRNKGQIPKYSTRTLLLCILSILKNCEPDLLKRWWSTMKPARTTTLLSIIKLCVSCFEYNPSSSSASKVTNKMAEKAENTKIELEMMFKNRPVLKHKQNSLDQVVGSRWARDIRKKASVIEVDSVVDEEDISESLVCAETSTITLDTIELLVERPEGDNVNLSSPIVAKILDVILLMMSSNQSIHVMKLIFATQRSMITKFPHIIFEEETDQCSSLCYNLLKHCASFVKEVREEAIASIYLLMRQNYESVGSFSRVKIQLTIALSRLRSDSSDSTKCNDTYLKRSLITLQNYADNDAELHSTRFPEQVKDVSMNLFMIMRDTVRMKEVKQDKDSAMRIDLMYRIAKGYQNSPALRITWLKSMAEEHKQNDAKCEAAMCLIHAAALISEYMYMVEYHAHLPQGCIAFEKISHNVLQECAVIDDVLKPDEDGMCTGGEFTEKGLVNLLIQASKLFMESNLFENVDEVYKILIKIYQHNRKNTQLSDIHKNLNSAYDRMKLMGKKRVLGSFFRVAFYGEKFGDLNGVTMIYKEKPFSKLPEISQRLQALYYEQFGDDFEFIADSRKLDPEQLDPYRAYVQVTYVEPYSEPFEMKYMENDFQGMYNLNRFIYSTPFTHQGSAHGNVREQFKRKTVLTTECCFPYVKNRLEVVEIREEVLTPIEVATEDMRRKNGEFEMVLGSGGADHKTDVKMLQMLIQGSIGTTVNQGPIEIIQTFLGESAEQPDIIDRSYIRNRNRLKYQCKHFLDNCKEALIENKSIMLPNQGDYQKEMEDNLRRFRKAVSPYIFNTHVQQEINKSCNENLENSLTRTMSYDATGLT